MLLWCILIGALGATHDISYGFENCFRQWNAFRHRLADLLMTTSFKCFSFSWMSLSPQNHCFLNQITYLCSRVGKLIAELSKLEIMHRIQAADDVWIFQPLILYRFISRSTLFYNKTQIFQRNLVILFVESPLSAMSHFFGTISCTSSLGRRENI